MRTAFDIRKKRERVKELEKEIEKPDFWTPTLPPPSHLRWAPDREKASKISREFAELKKEIDDWDELELEFELLKEEESKDYNPPAALPPKGRAPKIAEFERKLREKELQIFLSGKYDYGNAILSIYAGAGGQDAQDWATILLRMYERYCQRKGFKTKNLSQSFGEGGGPEGRIGTKSVSLEIKGNFAYGFLKKESGVHRLVRISPFSPTHLRHTSFALVEAIPEIPKPEELELKIRSEDLKIDFYRASGPGGQYVNKKETSVRITHLPTGISASCQSERFQAQNRKKATEMLTAKLYKILEESRQKELSKIKGKTVSASWGNQIRSYVLHPYKLVKDLRTEVETAQIEEVLDGELNQFIEAEIKLANTH